MVFPGLVPGFVLRIFFALLDQSVIPFLRVTLSPIESESLCTQLLEAEFFLGQPCGRFGRYREFLEPIKGVVPVGPEFESSIEPEHSKDGL